MFHATLLSLFFISPGAAAQDVPAAQPQLLDRVQALEDRLAVMENAPAKTSLSAFNPAMGMAIDMALTDANDKANFEFRSAELNLEAPIDPFLKGWAVFRGSTGTPAVDVEEAALETTALPWNLTARGGRLFALFGRLAHFHDHELPAVDRPQSLDTFIGGETRADGIELSYLAPLERYVSLTLGAYDKMGAENDRVSEGTPRPLDNFTYLGRLSTYQDMGDSHSLELGADCAWTPKRFVSDAAGLGETRANTWRTLSGVDLTYRFQPARAGLYRGLVWGTEVMRNDERRFDPVTLLPTDRVVSYGGFSYIALKAGRRWWPGVMVDLTEDLDNAHLLTKTYAAFLSCYVTEYQRLRLQFSEILSNQPGLKVHTVALQWTGILGHHVHGFRDR